MAKKPYSPVASYGDLKRVETLINEAQTVDEVRKITAQDGPKIGYKAFCYLLTNKMTPEGMKADEACVVAATLEIQGKAEEATEIYQRVLAVHKEHPIALSKVG